MLLKSETRCSCKRECLRWLSGIGGGACFGASPDNSDTSPQAFALLSLPSLPSCTNFLENGFVDEGSGRCSSLELALVTSAEPTRKGSLELEFERLAGPTLNDSGIVVDIDCLFLFAVGCPSDPSWPSLQALKDSGSEPIAELRSSCCAFCNLRDCEVSGTVGVIGYGGEGG
jgi:hypothetical protein